MYCISFNPQLAASHADNKIHVQHNTVDELPAHPIADGCYLTQDAVLCETLT